jgi:hypothetical protein
MKTGPSQLRLTRMEEEKNVIEVFSRSGEQVKSVRGRYGNLLGVRFMTTEPTILESVER